MPKKQPPQRLHITFHNANTTEETARFLAKILAESMAEETFRRQMASAIANNAAAVQYA